MRFATSLLATALSALVLSSCQNEAPAAAPATAAAAPAPAAARGGAAGPSMGERTARCADDTLGFFYAVQRQEYGDPWKERDTFVFFDAKEDRLQIAFLGGANTVDAAKTRVEARLGIVKGALERCEQVLGLEAGKASAKLFVTYSQVDRKAGTLKDIIIWQDGKFDFPSGSSVLSAREWLGELR